MKNTMLLSLENIQQLDFNKEKNLNEPPKQQDLTQKPQENEAEIRNNKSNSYSSKNANKIRKLSPCLTSEQESSGEFKSVANGCQEMKKLKANKNTIYDVECAE